MEVFITLQKITLEEFIERATAAAKSKAEAKTKRTGKIAKVRISRRKLHWIHLIETNQLVCPVTKKKVAYCGYDRKEYKKQPPTFHYNFYSEDGDMFTIDYRLPISQGGSKTAVSNIQPMIAEHNYAKANSLVYL